MFYFATFTQKVPCFFRVMYVLGWYQNCLVEVSGKQSLQSVDLWVTPLLPSSLRRDATGWEFALWDDSPTFVILLVKWISESMWPCWARNNYRSVIVNIITLQITSIIYHKHALHIKTEGVLMVPWNAELQPTYVVFDFFVYYIKPCFEASRTVLASKT